METNENVTEPVTESSESHPSAPEVTAPAEASQTENLSDGQTAAVENPYTPNYKFKVYDQEKEMDEWVRPLLSKENEEMFRKLFSQAHAFDPMKEKLKRAYEEFDPIKSEYSSTKQAISKLSKAVQSKDFDTFFKETNIPHQWIFEWVLQKSKYNEMSPEEREAHDERLTLRRRTAELEETNSELSTGQTEAIKAQRSFEIDSVLNRPDVNSIMQDYDRRSGRVGAFREEVILRGAARYYQTGKDIPAEQAVNEVLSLLGPRTAAEPGQASGHVTPQKDLPVIPNIKGKSSAVPMNKTPRSIADLRKLAAQMNG